MTTLPTTVDAEARRLLMLLNFGDGGKENYFQSSHESSNVSQVYEEARNLLALIGHPSSEPASTHVERRSSLIQIDTSGKGGRDGFSSRSGPRAIGGEIGGDAREIDLHLSTRGREIEARWGGERATLPLGDSVASIFLRAVGGKGGNGGRGENGKVGEGGARGRDATQYLSGTNGEDGKAGENGQHGGKGGKGGAGGRVKASLSHKDSDLLMLLNIPDVRGGVGGQGGLPGRGGAGGKGGEGGSHWSGVKYMPKTEYRTTYVNGRTVSQPVQVREAVPSYNPGGHRGSDGRKGHDGQRGNKGPNGPRGSFAMVVGGTSYTSRYDFLLTVMKVVDPSQGIHDGVVKLGERVRLVATVINQGGMPSPPQDIEFKLQTAEWFTSEISSLVLSQSLAVGQAHTFPTLFSFRANDHVSFPEGITEQRVTLTFRAVALRVNKAFASLNGMEVPFSLIK